MCFMMNPFFFFVIYLRFSFVVFLMIVKFIQRAKTLRGKRGHCCTFSHLVSLVPALLLSHIKALNYKVITRQQQLSKVIICQRLM